MFLFAELLAAWGGSQAAIPGIVCLLLFPTSFYFATFYTESLFLLATVSAFWAAHRKTWWLAALVGFAASLIRLNGCLIVLPIAWYAWEDAGRKWSRLRPAHFLAAAGPAAGSMVFPAYLWCRWGDPLLYVHAKASGWAQRPEAVWSLIGRIGEELRARLADPGSGGKLIFAAQVASALLFVFLTIVLFRKRYVAEGLYCASTLLLLLNSGSLDAIHRYVLVLFPCFFVLSEALRRRPVLAFGYVFAGLGIGVIFLFRFVHWMWVA